MENYAYFGLIISCYLYSATYLHVTIYMFVIALWMG